VAGTLQPLHDPANYLTRTVTEGDQHGRKKNYVVRSERMRTKENQTGEKRRDSCGHTPNERRWLGLYRYQGYIGSVQRHQKEKKKNDQNICQIGNAAGQVLLPRTRSAGGAAVAMAAVSRSRGQEFLRIKCQNQGYVSYGNGTAREGLRWESV